jgi:hypothetical protein
MSNPQVGLRSEYWKGAGFGAGAYAGPALEIAKDNGNQNKVFDPLGQPMNLSINSGTSRGRSHFNNPNGFSVSGQLSTPSAPTVTPTGGSASTWAYKIVARGSNGTTPASTAGQTTTGGATLSGTVYNTITWSAVTDAVYYDVYRTTAASSPSTTGFIARVTPGLGQALSVVDTGLTADSSTAPTLNTTGTFDSIASLDIYVTGLEAVQNTAITTGGTAGSTAYSYRVSAVTATGTENATASAASTSTGNATLSTTNYNTITWKPVPGATSYNVYRSASSGTPGTTGLIANVLATSSLTAVTVNDTGLTASGSVPTTNSTGSITASGGLRQNTSVTANQWKHAYAGGMSPTTSGTGTDTAGINGTVFISELFVPAAGTFTGISYLIGSVGGTDKVVVMLFDATGALVANSALDSSVTVGTNATFQRVPFTAAYRAVGPAKYYVGIQFNGTTAKLRTHAFGDHDTTSVSQTFNTPVAITPPTTFTASVGPYSMPY